MNYRLLIDIEVFDFLQALKPAQRRRLLGQFRLIQDFPTNHIEYTERDLSDRIIAVCIMDGFAIHYWDDFADRHVKILAVTPAGS